MAAGRNVVYNVSISELTIEETVHCSKNNIETVTRKSRKKKKDAKLSKEEFAQLKALEEKNGASKLNDD